MLPRPTGLYFPERLPFADWQRIGKQICLVSNASAWWLGDWLAYGEAAYADGYKRAVAETSLDYQTLRNYAWVARRFAMSRRRDKLSFQHHAEVAAMPEGEQEVWLDRAQTFGWSRNELRRKVRAARDSVADPEPLASVILRLAIARDRERRWHEAAERANRSLEDWMAAALDQAADAMLEAAERSLLSAAG